jgi:hypothetical protein
MVGTVWYTFGQMGSEPGRHKDGRQVVRLTNRQTGRQTNRLTCRLARWQ